VKIPSLARVVRGVCWRLIRRAQFVVFSAPANALGMAELSVLRVNRHSSVELLERSEEAMHAAGEPAGLTAARFARGDEFFGVQQGEYTASFGWVTYRERAIHGVRLKDTPGRVFLYHFHTLAAYRGRRLYPGLLVVIRQHLGREGVAEFIIDVDARNEASIRGVGRAGFTAVGRLDFLVFFNHGYRLWSLSVDAGVPDGLFLQ
jgi:RimJ/RimL family protein N-acetyltransferase